MALSKDLTSRPSTTFTLDQGGDMASDSLLYFPRKRPFGIRLTAYAFPVPSVRGQLESFPSMSEWLIRQPTGGKFYFPPSYYS